MKSKNVALSHTPNSNFTQLKATSAGRVWEHNAMFKTTKSFEISAKSAKSYMVGVVIASADPGTKDMEENYDGVFFEPDTDCFKAYSKCCPEVDGCEKWSGMDWDSGKDPSQRVYVRFDWETRTVSFSIQRLAGQYIILNSKLPPGDYVPCILIRNSATVTFAVSQDTKRKRAEERAGEAFRAAWETRKFCDGVVVCGEKRWEIHRHIICAESEVMHTAFVAPMREAKEQVVTIDFPDATEDGVELMLEYMYTKEVRDGGDYSLLLPLAHFYQMPELTALCTRKIVDRVTEQNVVHTLRMLNRYKDIPEVDESRKKLVRKIAGDREPTQLLREVAGAVA